MTENQLNDRAKAILLYDALWKAYVRFISLENASWKQNRHGKLLLEIIESALCQSSSYTVDELRERVAFDVALLRRSEEPMPEPE